MAAIRVAARGRGDGSQRGPRRAVGRGRGELLEPVPPHPPLGFLLIVPDFVLTTAAVYEALGPLPES